MPDASAEKAKKEGSKSEFRTEGKRYCDTTYLNTVRA